ncbi:FtsX-like permease family protein [Spirosoma foliorum]|uniref:ABC transporter permease n=1 Tax=Spirosoma foliorum TaxID=2710596 RepID=A0A7G5GW84_9BACT|nr:FtsX-like permease family protein [Spirosoma foliorum]QMW03126.1 ABC transporter permease [Spirosoma foliorum]
MLKSYLNIAIRNLSRNRLTTALNVVGLSIGVAACLVIYLIVQFEFNFDQHVPNSGQVYRLVSKFKFGDDFYHNPGLSAPIPAAVRTELTGTKTVAAFHTGSFEVVEVPRPGAEPIRVRTPDNEHDWLAITDAAFFEIMPRQWIAGSPKASLSKPGQIVLTERQSRLYFGDASPAVIGRRLIGQQYRDTLALTVSGLLKDLDAPSDFDFKSFVSLATVSTSKKRRDNLSFAEWNNTNSSSQCLLTLTPGTDPKRFGERVIKMVESHMPASEEKGNRWFILQPLADVHFNVDYGSGGHVAHRPTLLVLGLVGIFLLLLACINFINMATAQSTQRAKEIGVRKSLGSAQKQLIFQFLGETFVLTLLATGIAIVLAQGALAYLSDIVPTGVALDFSQPQLYIFLLLVALVTALLAGIYPGLLISKLSPVLALRNQTTQAAGSASLRKVLIVGQFVVAQVFIVGALLVGQQLRFLINSDLGFQREAIVTFSTPTSSFFNGDRHDVRFTLADQIRKLTGVERVSMANQTPIAGGWSTSTLEFAGKKGKIKVNVYRKEADTAYLGLYGMKLLAGRNLLPSDTAREYIVNETLAKRIGFLNPADAVGKVLDKFPIIGVVRDFHHRSLHNAIQPTALMSHKGNLHVFNIQFRRGGADSFDKTLAQIKTLWGNTYPDEAFTPKFFDESVAELYGKERNLGKLITLATGIAVLISCLGLFGLVTFTAERRMKEIGVRKVLGASIASIVTLLAKDFLILILIAVFIASPVAWWGVDRWLQDFAYKIDIGWWLFILAALLAVGIALLTISFQSIKAALMNPVKSLRAE